MNTFRQLTQQLRYEAVTFICARVLCAKFVALAFVPPQDVTEAFDLLVDSMPQGIDRMDEVVTYFEHTYIRGRRLRGRGGNYREASFPIEL